MLLHFLFVEIFVCFLVTNILYFNIGFFSYLGYFFTLYQWDLSGISTLVYIKAGFHLRNHLCHIPKSLLCSVFNRFLDNAENSDMKFH